MLFFDPRKLRVPAAHEALPGRQRPAHPIPERHFVSGNVLSAPFPEGVQLAGFGMGCFWGAERKFWKLHGIYSTAVGYSAGSTPNPTYREVCTGMTGHNEVVQVAFVPAECSYDTLLSAFWENHDPTQGMRQGNDRGTQYRSGIYVYDTSQRAQAERSRDLYAARIAARGFTAITTEILDAGPFWYAEAEHQQYLAKHPDGYCGLGGTGVACPL
ncbi:MAG: peptide-methionine (S)-S-oxide reductase MsrA [Myxococcales bacterium]|nr:peptide-methionine (S)-S-oxide reductase MsrA [Myxococcales bacterium]